MLLTCEFLSTLNRKDMLVHYSVQCCLFTCMFTEWVGNCTSDAPM